MSAYSDIVSDGGMDPRNKQDATARWAVFCAGCRKEWSVPYQHPGKSVCNKCETTLRQALEQPAQQEPVGYVYSVHGERIKNACIESDVPNGAPVYISVQRKPWVGLTDAQIGAVAADIWGSVLIAPQSCQAFARAIEAKLKEKNG